MFLKIVSVVVLGPPLQPQEEDKLFTVLLLANIAFKMSLGMKLFGFPSKTTISASPGAMAMAISISSETSGLPLLAPVVGTPLKPSSKTVWMTMFVRPFPAAVA